MAWETTEIPIWEIDPITTNKPHLILEDITTITTTNTITITWIKTILTITCRHNNNNVPGNTRRSRIVPRITWLVPANKWKTTLPACRRVRSSRCGSWPSVPNNNDARVAPPVKRRGTMVIPVVVVVRQIQSFLLSKKQITTTKASRRRARHYGAASGDLCAVDSVACRVLKHWPTWDGAFYNKYSISPPGKIVPCSVTPPRMKMKMEVVVDDCQKGETKTETTSTKKIGTKY